MSIARIFCILIALINIVGCTTWQPPREQYLQPKPNIQNQLSSTYLGTSSIALSDGTNTILFDGFFSRKSLKELITTDMVSDPKMVNDGLKRAGLKGKKINALFIAHNHYDHAIDAFSVANITKTTLHAPKETLALAEYRDEVELSDMKEYTFDGFKVKAIRTPHVEKCLPIQLVESSINWLSNGEAFKHAHEAYSFLVTHNEKKILIVPSAAFRPIKNLNADVVFLGVGLLGTRPKEETKLLWKSAVLDTGAKLVIPIHWDNISKTITDEIPAIPWYADNLKKTMVRLNGFADDNENIRILYPPAYTRFTF